MEKNKKITTTSRDVETTKEKPILDNLEKLVKTESQGFRPRKLLVDLDTAYKAYNEVKGTKKAEDAEKTLNNVYNDAVYAYSLDNHVAITGSVTKTYRPLVVGMTEQLMAEFDCKAPHEKALAELIASSYARYIQFTSFFNNAQNIDYLSTEKTNYYTMFSKEADKAHRQFTNALMTLKQIKTPVPTVNVMAKNAFVAQNQQLNTFGNEKQKEIVNG
ncbi:hypothetical protein HYV31_00805 [candidate division WWE3 bacterium]|nr:hypothetical protein [candidate division WWE3 bacterium]